MILKVYKMVFIYEIYKSLTEFLEEIYEKVYFSTSKKSARFINIFVKKVCKMVFIHEIYKSLTEFLEEIYENM